MQEPIDAAFLYYRQLVEEENTVPVIVRTDLEHTEAQDTWWEMTESECETFELDPRLANAMHLAYTRYESMVGMVNDDHFEQFRDLERANWPKYFPGERAHSIDKAVGFMTDACFLPYTQVIAWVCRHEIQSLRSRLSSDGRDCPAWALADAKLGTYADYRRLSA